MHFRPLLALLLAPAWPATPATPLFLRQTIDVSMAGDCKMTGDPDGDAYPNLIEFGFGTHALIGDGPAPTPRLWTDSARSRVGLDFRQAHPTLAMVPEPSEDLATWRPLSGLAGHDRATVGTDGGVPVTRASIDLPEAAAFFLRLRTGL